MMGSVLSTCHADGCPVDHKNLSKDQITALMSDRHKSKSSASQESAQLSKTESANDKLCPVDQENMSDEQRAASKTQHFDNKFRHDYYPSANSNASDTTNSASRPSGSCPVDHEKMSKEQITALLSSSKNQTVKRNRSSESKSNEAVPAAHGTMYDVYGQKLDASNLMPATPNQLPSPGQRDPLSTDRAKSTIPKQISTDGSSETWTYPSPQMFFNALRRKGKADGVEEGDMPAVVSVHNRMNERTWNEVTKWETRFHCEQCKTPTLKRFQGRPQDVSPVARFRMWFRGYPRPFDRHDWIVDRCGLAEARYVIDYYFHENSVEPIEIHVRPAVDSLSAVHDRFRSGLLFLKHIAGFSIPSAYQRPDVTPAMHTDASQATGHQKAHNHENYSDRASVLPVLKGDQLEEQEFSFLTELTPSTVGEIADDVQKRCQNAHIALQSASNDPTKLEQANVSLNYCMAARICSRQAQSFMTALESGSDPSDAYSKMTDCLDRFQIMARRTLLDAAGVILSGPEFVEGVIPTVAQASAGEAANSNTKTQSHAPVTTANTASAAGTQ